VLHDLTVGHLDPEAVRLGQLRVHRPLSSGAAAILARFVDSAGMIGGQPFVMTPEYIRLPWFRPARNRVAEQAALALAAEEGCILADVKNGRLVDPSQLLRP